MVAGESLCFVGDAINPLHSPQSVGSAMWTLWFIPFTAFPMLSHIFADGKRIISKEFIFLKKTIFFVVEAPVRALHKKL